jgi:hypothetical protein
VESKLLMGIKAELSTPEYLEEFKRAVRRALADVRSARGAQCAAREKRLAELSGEIENMVAAIAAGLLSPTLKSKLEAAEAERAAMASHASESDLPTVATILPRLAGTYAALVEDLEHIPPRYVDRARTALKGLIGEVRLIPEGELAATPSSDARTIRNESPILLLVPVTLVAISLFLLVALLLGEFL